MNCVQFEGLITDLARDEAVATAAREAALAHAQACGRCGARLADEHALSVGLRALSMASQDEQAPWNVEAALREAFGQAHRPVPMRQRTWWAPVAIAAGLLLAWGVGYRLTRLSAIPDRHLTAQAPPQTEPAAAPAGPEEVPAAAVETAPEGASPVRTALAGDAPFFPLLYGDDLTSLEAGRVVRVRLPRAALTSFGVPVAEERRTERVEAEVLLGEDGLARAIRFERDVE